MSKLVLVRNISGGIFAMPSDSPLVTSSGDLAMPSTSNKGSIICNTLNYQNLNPQPPAGAQGAQGSSGAPGESGGADRNGKLLGTNVWWNDRGTTTTTWGFNTRGFNPVFNQTLNNYVGIRLNSEDIPKSGYIRIEANIYIVSDTTPSFCYLGLSSRIFGGREGAGLTYGWINPGLNNDIADQVCQVKPIWEIDVTTLEEDPFTPGTFPIYLHGYGSKDGMSILFQGASQNIGIDIPSSFGPSGGPLTMSAYVFKSIDNL